MSIGIVQSKGCGWCRVRGIKQGDGIFGGSKRELAKVRYGEWADRGLESRTRKEKGHGYQRTARKEVEVEVQLGDGDQKGRRRDDLECDMM
jgi:hypothetical protein